MAISQRNGSAMYLAQHYSNDSVAEAPSAHPCIASPHSPLQVPALPLLSLSLVHLQASTVAAFGLVFSESPTAIWWPELTWRRWPGHTAKFKQRAQLPFLAAPQPAAQFPLLFLLVAVKPGGTNQGHCPTIHVCGDGRSESVTDQLKVVLELRSTGRISWLSVLHRTRKTSSCQTFI